MQAAERRTGVERRNRTLAAYLHGSRKPRRLSGRRSSDRFYAIVDWHPPHILALTLAILGLCAFDGVLTVVLIAHGATEANPFMALFVPQRLGWFAAVKLGLTAVSLAILVACSRMRLARCIPGESLLYVILAGYVALITYELRLLEFVSAEG